MAPQGHVEVQTPHPAQTVSITLATIFPPLSSSSLMAWKGQVLTHLKQPTQAFCVDPRDGRVRFEHVLREQGEDLCCCRASLAHGSRDILGSLGGARQIDPRGIRLHGAKLGMALHVEAVRIVGDVELFGELRRPRALRSRQWRAPRGRPRPRPACRGACPRPGRPSSLPLG